MTPSPGCGALGKSLVLSGLQEAQEAGVHLLFFSRSGFSDQALGQQAGSPQSLRSLGALARQQSGDKLQGLAQGIGGDVGDRVGTVWWSRTGRAQGADQAPRVQK